MLLRCQILSVLLNLKNNLNSITNMFNTNMFNTNMFNNIVNKITGKTKIIEGHENDVMVMMVLLIVVFLFKVSQLVIIGIIMVMAANIKRLKLLKTVKYKIF